MKTVYQFLFAVILLITTNALQAQSLKINDPQFWYSADCDIDEAVLSVKPKGIYMEYGLYLTFAPTYNYYVSDTFEVVMNFNLPIGSFIHDSWLWVDSQIVQADIIERGLATAIYEGIVNRRKDPSLLYKNSDINYELRVFPMAGNSSRKVKITYLVPVNWTSAYVSTPLPIDIVKLSQNVPHLQLLVEQNSRWGMPQIDGLPQISFSLNQQNQFAAQIASNNITGNSSLSLSFKSPLLNGVYVEQYDEGNNEGYYQMIMMPKEVLSLTSSKKVNVLVDYKSANTYATSGQLAATLKSMLHNYFNDNDSFNLMFSKSTIYSASSNWLPADSITIENVFAALPASIWNNNGYLSSLLIGGVSFINNHGKNGEILLFSSSSDYNMSSISNNIIHDLELIMGQPKIPVNIINMQDKNFALNGGSFRSGNHYFFTNLSISTGGNYLKQFNDNYNGTYNFTPQIVNSFEKIVDQMALMLDGKIADFDLYTSVNNGFCYGRFDITDNTVAYLNRPVMQIGKYVGSIPFEIELAGRYNGNIVSHSLQVQNPVQTNDSLLRKMWAHSLIYQLEHTSMTNQIMREIIDSSVNNRVLSRYTAFLALEPNDTVSVCETCEDETGNPSATGIDDLISELLIQAMPNPFSDMITVSFELPNNEKVTIQVFNLMGQLVKTLEPETANSQITATWNGTDENGAAVSEGIYLIVVSSDTYKTTLRIVKSN